MLTPAAAAIEACSNCQLRCPLCPTTRGENLESVGRGALSLDNFRKFLEDAPSVKEVELGNYGEVFLNKQLPDILALAHQRGVKTQINAGANLNNASDEALQAVVKHQLQILRVAIDGITQESYAKYRVRGNLANVIANVRRINQLKKEHNSQFPQLIFQFVVFGHNQHEMAHAKVMAKLLNMQLEFKHNFTPDQLAVIDKEAVRQELGHADRKEFEAANGQHYRRSLCLSLWHSPQVNWDGRLLGCSRNVWGHFGPNVFEVGLVQATNSPRMESARQLVSGQVTEDTIGPHGADLPCYSCGVYRSMKTHQSWITQKEVELSADDPFGNKNMPRATANA